MKLSVSKISTFLDCPRKYAYEYEMGIQIPKKEGFYFGSAVHSGLEQFYKGKDPMQGVAQALFGKKSCLKEEAEEGIDPHKLYSEARKIFEVYKQDAPYFQPKEVENFFEVEMIHPETKEELPVIFVGKMDLITSGEDIVDHKTSKSENMTFYEAKNELQMRGYSYAYFMLNHKLPKRFIFNYILRKKPPRITIKKLYPTLYDICSFFEVFKKVSILISQRKTMDSPKPSKWNCRFCQYKNICPKSKA